jgi:hypothetical protein
MANGNAGAPIRGVNDRAYNMLWGFGELDGAFLCECNGSFCIEEVSMTLSEYVRMRDRGDALLANGHARATSTGSLS